MSDTIIRTKTYGCTCGYRLQGVDPYSDHYMTTFGVRGGICASCKTEKLGLVLDAADQSNHIVADDSTLEATMVPDRDANGQQIMEQVGSHWELQVNQSNGAITSVEVPDYAPKMRPLTDQELADLKAQRDQNLDELESVAVSSTTATTSTDTTTPTDQPSITI